MTYPIIIHGSENSLDIDAYVLLPDPIDFKAAKALCDSYKEINANLLCVKNGEVIWSYKGTVDECNNSIIATYGLHEQAVDNPVTHRVERNYALKMLRTVRGLLSYNSRTALREEVKKALTSESLDYKIEVLKKINLNEVKDFQKSTLIETYKFLAFQMGQTRALLEDNVELFTKNAVAQYYPELKDYLARENASPVRLQEFYENFVSLIERSYSPVKKQPFFVTCFHGVRQVLDVKKEKVLPPVVVFDIDGTLLDESHRAFYRESGNLDKYYELCDKDTPVQHIIDLTHTYKQKGYEIWLMSGRRESSMEKTLASLKEHNVEFDHIKLRKDDNHTPDYVLKPAWISQYIGLERVEVVYDDSPRVIEGFRSKGLNVVNVTDAVVKNLFKPKV